VCGDPLAQSSLTSRLSCLQSGASRRHSPVAQRTQELLHGLYLEWSTEPWSATWSSLSLSAGSWGDTAFSTYSMLCTVSNCPYRPCITITASDLALKPVTASKITVAFCTTTAKSGSASIIRRVGVVLVNLWVCLFWRFVSRSGSEHPNVYRHLFPLKTMLEFLVQAVERHFSGRVIFLPSTD